MIENGKADILDVEGNAVGCNAQQDDRADQREGEPDAIAHEFGRFAPGKGPGEARPAAGSGW